MSTTCEGCGGTFEARRSTARYCSASCRAKADRRRRTERAVDSGQAARTVPTDSDLVAAVRRELSEADVLDTFDGQLALLLAAQVAHEGTSGLAGLSAELRRAMALALANVSGPEDEVARARARVAEVRRLAGLEVDQ